MADEKEVGYVYIMTNPCFKDNIIKVGMALDPEVTYVLRQRLAVAFDNLA